MSGMPTSWADESDSDGEDIPKTRPSQQQQQQAPPPAARQQQAPPAAQHTETRPARPKNEINPNGPFFLFVGNLTFEVTANDLGNFFFNGGCDVVDVKVQTDRETGRSRGFAHVEVRDLPSLEKGLTASGHEFMGRRLNVDVGKAPHGYKQERRGAERERTGFDSRRGGSRDRERGTRPPQERDDAPLERGLKVERRDRPEKARTPKGADAAPATAAAAPVVERKKIEIKPRSVPVGETADGSAPRSYSSIFGDAKPRDEKVVEKKADSAAPALPEPPVEKLEELKVSPPAVPAEEGLEARKAAGDKKERRPTKQTWSEGHAAGRGEGRTSARSEGRGEGRVGRGEAGRGDRRDSAGGRGRGRGERPERDGKTADSRDRAARPAREGKTGSGPRKGDRKAEAVEDKSKSARPVSTLTDNVGASAVESQKAATNAKPKQVNMFANLGGDSDSDED